MPTHAAPPHLGSPHDVAVLRAAALRTEALRQLRWQQQTWARILTRHEPGTPCLVASAERAGLDVLREAGEDVPSRFYRRRSLARHCDATRGTAARVCLVSLMADVNRVLAWVDPEGAGVVPLRAELKAAPGSTSERRSSP
jgi:hypothetical protein